MEELAVGATFAGHVIRAVAGRGGMGTVYRADWNGRDVALKVIAAEWSQDREYRTRFQREYHAEASIQHPNVIRVYGAGATEGRLYVTMRSSMAPISSARSPAAAASIRRSPRG